MSLAQCFARARKFGIISGLEEIDLNARYEKIMKEATDPAAARAQIVAELEAESAHRKRAALLSEAARSRIFDAINGYRDHKGRVNKAEAFLALHENFGDLGSYVKDAVNLQETITRKAHRDLALMLKEGKRGAILGDLRRQSKLIGNKRQQARLDNVVRELFGEVTGDETAATIAKAWVKVSTDLKDRFNAAGGAIGTMEKWGLPQSHDREALLTVGKQAWVDYHLKDGVLDRERMVHPLSRKPYSDVDLRDALGVSWERITTDGWSDRELELGGQARRPALYRQHMDHRFLHYKNADAWLAYQRAYGAPDPFGTMMGHIHHMARDIAHMETFGPNPNVVRDYIKSSLLKDAATLPSAEVVWRENHEQMKRLLAMFPARQTGVQKLHDAINAKMDEIQSTLAELQAQRDSYTPAKGPRRKTKAAMDKLSDKLSKQWEEIRELEKQHDGIDIILHDDPVVESAAREEYQQLLKEAVDPDRIVDGVKSDKLQAFLNKKFAKADAMWENMRGSAPVDITWANRMSATRNLVSAAALGGAWFSSLADPAHGQLMRQRMGQSLMESNAGKVLAKSLFEMVTMMSRDEAVSAGLGLDSALQVMRQQARMNGDVDVRGWSGYVTDRVLTWTMLQPWTQAGKHIAGMDIMRWVAKLAQFDFKSLPETTQFAFNKHGFGAAEWERIRTAEKHNGMIRESEVEKVAGRDLSERYLAMILRETRHAVPETTVESRAIVTGLKAGTLYGEIVRSAGQFKGFPIAVVYLLGRWVARDMLSGQNKSIYAHAGAYMISAMMLGATAMALKDIGAGRDPRRWLDEKTFLDPKMWAAAILQSGGLGIYGDLLFSDVGRHGGGIQKMIAGPLADRVDSAVLQPVAMAVDAYKGKKVHAGKLGVDILRQWTPGQNMWFSNLLVQRHVFDQLERMADPAAYAAKVRSDLVKRKQDFGQDYWWQPGDRAPRRAPNIGRILATR